MIALANPVVSKAIGADKLSKVFAYKDFRDQIHQYQREHNVSGLVWHPCTFKGQTIQLPEIHPDLTAIPADKAALAAAKADIIAFWRASSQGLRLWAAGHDPVEIDAATVEGYIKDAEWADVSATRSELYLGLCGEIPKNAIAAGLTQNRGVIALLPLQLNPALLRCKQYFFKTQKYKNSREKLLSLLFFQLL